MAATERSIVVLPAPAGPTMVATRPPPPAISSTAASWSSPSIGSRTVSIANAARSSLALTRTRSSAVWIVVDVYLAGADVGVLGVVVDLQRHRQRR